MSAGKDPDRGTVFSGILNVLSFDDIESGKNGNSPADKFIITFDRGIAIHNKVIITASTDHKPGGIHTIHHGHTAAGTQVHSVNTGTGRPDHITCPGRQCGTDRLTAGKNGHCTAFPDFRHGSNTTLTDEDVPSQDRALHLSGKHPTAQSADGRRIDGTVCVVELILLAIVSVNHKTADRKMNIGCNACGICEEQLTASGLPCSGCGMTILEILIRFHQNITGVTTGREDQQTAAGNDRVKQTTGLRSTIYSDITVIACYCGTAGIDLCLIGMTAANDIEFCTGGNQREIVFPESSKLNSPPERWITSAVPRLTCITPSL